MVKKILNSLQKFLISNSLYLLEIESYKEFFVIVDSQQNKLIVTFKDGLYTATMQESILYQSNDLNVIGTNILEWIKEK